MQKVDRLNLRLFILFFALITGYNLYIFKGMVHSLAFAAIIAGTFYPLHNAITRKFGLRPEANAAITTTIVTIAILLPLAFILFQVSKEGVDLYGHIREGLSVEQVKNLFFGDGPIAQAILRISHAFELDIDLEKLYMGILKKTQSYSGKVIGKVNGIVGDILGFLFQFLIMVVAIFSLFLDGDKMKKFFFKLNPLPDDQEEVILEKFSQMNYVTLVCNGLGGIIQGGLAGIGFWIAGLNSVFLWSTVMVVLAFIPLVGISFVTIPASIFLFATGQQTAAVILFIYTTIIALVVENWFKPRFMGPRVKVNSLVLLFYIIAGMQTFGMAGIFYGPLLCTIFLAMVELFQDYYLPRLYK